MKKFLKLIGAVVLACALAAGGYMAGQRVQMNSITSALPRETIEKHDESIEPEPKTDSAAEPEASMTAGEEPPPVKAPESAQTEKNIIEKNSATAIQEGWTEVETVTAVFSDNIKGDVKLYTSAEKDVNGEFVWDDGNQWVLEVTTDKDSYYTLLNKYVQLGEVNIMVGADENNECVITAVISTGNGLVVEKYTYNGAAFEGQTVYNSGAVNVWGSTFNL